MLKGNSFWQLELTLVETGMISSLNLPEAEAAAARL